MMTNNFIGFISSKKYNQNKGLTLIEVIISVVIIGIMAVSFLTIFTNNFFTVFSMGRKSEAVAANQKIMELFYSGEDISAIDTIITIELPNTEYSRTVGAGAEGTDLIIVTTTYNNGSKTVKLSAFVPYP